MYAQLTYFDGPRSPEVIAANDRAADERITPAILAHPVLRDELIAVHVLRQPDGSQVTIVFTKTAEALEIGHQVVGQTELLPDEDPALLLGPDRLEIYEVVSSDEPVRTRA